MTSVKRKSTKASWSSNREQPKSSAPAEKVERTNGVASGSTKRERIPVMVPGEAVEVDGVAGLEVADDLAGAGEDGAPEPVAGGLRWKWRAPTRLWKSTGTLGRGRGWS